MQSVPHLSGLSSHRRPQVFLALGRAPCSVGRSNHTTGTRNMNTLAEQWTHFQYAQDRTGSENSTKRQQFHEHAQHRSRHTHVLFHVECRNFANLWRIGCHRVFQSTAWSNSLSSWTPFQATRNVLKPRCHVYA